jgi:hypothetical protein
MGARSSEFKEAREARTRMSSAFYGEGSYPDFWKPILEIISKTTSKDELKAIRGAVQRREQQLISSLGGV